MLHDSKEQLLRFINQNNLIKENAIISFEADVNFYNRNDDNVTQTVCELHIITLSNELVLYILNGAPATGPFSDNDVFSTAKFSFFHTENNRLEISGSDGNTLFTVSLKQN